MSEEESGIVFKCAGERLVGILHAGNEERKTGVVIVVGGPQYRVGSHRQFVLMARHFAKAGFPVLRFDYRGMGDAEGDSRSFEEVDDDIRAAVDALMNRVTHLESVVLLGLCDAASAALMYCLGDDRLGGLVLLNPWVRTEQGEAKAFLKHYYLQRLMQRSFWTKVFTGKFRILEAIRGLSKSVQTARRPTAKQYQAQTASLSFLERMRTSIEAFEKPIVLITSGRDLTAREFLDLCESDRAWESAKNAAGVLSFQIDKADHTMARRPDLEKASQYITDALTAWSAGDMDPHEP